jgi:hypothetical protein
MSSDRRNDSEQLGHWWVFYDNTHPNAKQTAGFATTVLQYARSAG